MTQCLCASRVLLALSILAVTALLPKDGWNVYGAGTPKPATVVTQLRISAMGIGQSRGAGLSDTIVANTSNCLASLVQNRCVLATSKGMVALDKCQVFADNTYCLGPRQNYKNGGQGVLRCR